MFRCVVAIALISIVYHSSTAFAQRGDGAGSARKEKPLTPGFGEESTLPVVPGFGILAGDAGGARGQGVPLADRFHPKVVAYVDQVLRRLDRDGDGRLTRAEWSATRWRSDPSESDLNKDNVLTREELCERVKGYDEFRGLGSSASPNSTSGSPASDRAKLDEYAKGLMKRYDKNDNGVLEAEEYGEMSSFHRGADANGDKIITRDELATRLANFGNASSSENAGSSDESKRVDHRGGSSSGRRTYASRRFYRPRTVMERLPDGLPDWFARNDADSDGQISMAEFAVSWTDAKVEEFAEYDANGDGFITPHEFLSGDRHRRDAGATSWRSRGR